jgi:hypothetical protein
LDEAFQSLALRIIHFSEFIMIEAPAVADEAHERPRPALIPMKDNQPVPSRMLELSIRWWSTVQMGGLLLLGLATATGHHVYHTSLDGRLAGSANRQEWSIRFGTAFAYFTQTSLGASVVCAYSQHIWTVFKSKPVSIKVIDAMFSATADPTAFGTREMF